MFRLTLLLVFLRERDRPRRELAADPDLYDLIDLLAERDDLLPRRDDFDRADLERFLSFLPLLLRLRRSFLPFVDFRELLLFFDERLRLLLVDLVLEEDRFFDPDLDLRLRAEAGALLLAERCFLIICISASMLFILRFFLLVSVASIIDEAMSSKFYENPITRLLNCDNPPLLR